MIDLKINLNSNMFLPNLGDLIKGITIHIMQKHSELRVLESVDLNEDMDVNTNKLWDWFVELFEEHLTHLLKDFCDNVSVNVYDDYNVEHMNSKNNLQISVTFNEDKVNKNGIVLNSLFTTAILLINCNNHNCDECRRLQLPCNKVCDAMNNIDELANKSVIIKNLSSRSIESIIEFITVTNLTAKED